MLKLCPFCGSKIVGPLKEYENCLTKEINPSYIKLGVVGCAICGANGPSLYEKEELISKWNERHYEAQIEDLISRNKLLRDRLDLPIEFKKELICRIDLLNKLDSIDEVRDYVRMCYQFNEDPKVENILNILKI